MPKRLIIIGIIIIALLWWKPQTAALVWRFLEDMFRLMILSR
jgi:hypothetical protein